MDEAAEAFTALDAAPEPTVARGFLVQGQAAAHALSLAADECIGFLAIGRGEAKDLSLELFTRTGIALAENSREARHAYVKWCGAAGLGLVAIVRLNAGNGEYRLLTVHHAPTREPDLDRTVGACFATTVGVTETLADVGPLPRAGTPEEALTAATEQLAALGYRPTGTSIAGTLEARQTTSHPFRLDAHRCYAVAVVGGAAAEDLDLMVRSASDEVLGRDIARSRDAVVKFCALVSGSYSVDVRMYDGSGDYRVASFVMEEPAGVPRGLADEARLPLAELSARTRAHGLSLRPLGWAYLYPGAALGWPVELVAGRCYGFGVLPSGESLEVDADVKLVDDRGVLMGWDVGSQPSALMFHCAERTGVYRVLFSMYGQPGRVLALEAEE